MRMDIKYKDGNAIFLHYEQFKVASAKDKYKLTVGGLLVLTLWHSTMEYTLQLKAETMINGLIIVQ